MGSLYYDNEWYKENTNLETVLLIGLDKFDRDIEIGEYDFMNKQQSDFLLLLIIDREHETYSGLQINRDTMTWIDQLGLGGKVIKQNYEQLAMAHTYGSGGKDSCRNTVKAVSELLYGIRIDHYISVTMDAISILTDQVGGVPVEVLVDFPGIDDTLIKGETVLLDGSHALTYVRARSGMEDSSNVSRMERQHQYLLALLERLKDKMRQESGFALNCLLSLSDSMVSDCSNNELLKIIEMTDSYAMGPLETLKGNAEKGEQYMEFRVDADELKKTVMDLFFVKAES